MLLFQGAQNIQDHKRQLSDDSINAYGAWTIDLKGVDCLDWREKYWKVFVDVRCVN